MSTLHNVARLALPVLLSCCMSATAQDVLLLGHIEKVVLLPPGVEHCPAACPAVEPVRADGSRLVCVSNDGGCQAMDVRVEQVFRGEAGGAVRHFSSRIGEWGPTFSVTARPVVVSVAAGVVRWSPAEERGGKLFVDPKRLRLPAVQTDEEGMAALEELLKH